MELRQLEHFLAVAEAQSFTRAARRMNIVQSGLSMSIQALEQELDAPLFVRNPRSVILTPAGRALVDEARRTLAAVRAARDAVAETQGLLRGSFVIGLAQVLPPSVPVLRHLAEFRRQHPAVRVHLWQGTAQRGYEALVEGKVDLTIGGLPPRLSARIATIELAESPIVLAFAPPHPLAARAAVSFDELHHEPFVDFSREWAARELTERAFELAGCKRHVAFETSDVWTLLRLVSEGFGVAVVPRVVGEIPSDVRFVPITAALPAWKLVAAFLGDQPVSVAARTFLEMLVPRATVTA